MRTHTTDDYFPGTLEVPFLRVCQKATGATLYRQMARHCLVKAQAIAHQRITINDYPAQEHAKTALTELGFADMGEAFEKLELRGILTGAQIRKELIARSDGPEDGLGEWGNEFIDPKNLANAEWCLWNEHYLWPCKIADGSAPAYVVPIEPRWAEALFDEALANQTLFGRDQRLALNVEGVYYRSARRRIECPAHLLWYVSEDPKRRADTMAVRACSAIDSVKVGLPKELFREYHHLGAYEWQHVYETAKGDVNKPIMAIRFSQTEQFSKPVKLSELRRVMQSFGVNIQFPSPTPIPHPVFLELYRLGMS